jgi:hypothetical protein
MGVGTREYFRRIPQRKLPHQAGGLRDCSRPEDNCGIALSSVGMSAGR